MLLKFKEKNLRFCFYFPFVFSTVKSERLYMEILGMRQVW